MKRVGLVLAGGGGRGAYQIGVWKALRDTGLEQYITSISGTSVGGLNAALFIQNDLEKAQSIWESISMRKILTHKSDSEHGHVRLSLFERDGLEKIIDDNLDMRCFDNSEYDCWMTCARTDGPHNGGEEMQYTTSSGKRTVRKYMCGHTEYFNLKYVDDDITRKKIILGTSAMPFVFPKEIIDGSEYLDGGARLLHGDNVPVKPLYEICKCNMILIVHLSNMDELVDRKKFPDAALFEIFPKKKLGNLKNADGVFDFTEEGATRRIQQGYEDNYALFRRIRQNINSGQEMLTILADGYAKEQQYSLVKKGLQEEAVELMRKPG